MEKTKMKSSNKNKLERKNWSVSKSLGIKRDFIADLQLPWIFVKSGIINSHFKWDYPEIEKYCMFIGYPRSGHTLVGSLLDAHPDIVISHELDALYFFRNGFDRNRIFSLILHKDKVFTGKGRHWTGYDYSLKDLWQGRYRHLKVIGDKKGGKSSLHLISKPNIINDLKKEVDLPLRLIHVVRHPLDNIATHHRKWGRGHTIQETVNDYFNRVQAVSNLKPKISKEEWLEFKLENFILDPSSILSKLLEALEVEKDTEYLKVASSKVFASPSKSRSKLNWPNNVVEQIAERSQEFDFLKDYKFIV